MAIIGSVFAMFGRFAGRLLNAVLGWATLLLFGKVSGSKQTVLLLVALGSLLWVVTVFVNRATGVKPADPLMADIGGDGPKN